MEGYCGALKSPHVDSVDPGMRRNRTPVVEEKPGTSCGGGGGGGGGSREEAGGGGSVVVGRKRQAARGYKRRATCEGAAGRRFVGAHIGRQWGRR